MAPDTREGGDPNKQIPSLLEEIQARGNEVYEGNLDPDLNTDPKRPQMETGGKGDPLYSHMLVSRLRQDLKKRQRFTD